MSKQGGYADNIVTIHMTRIRRKIQKAGLPWRIINFPGFGYELAEQQTRSTMKSVAGALAIALLLAHPVIGRLF